MAGQHPVPWLASSLQPADACLLVIDLGEPAVVDQTVELHDLLAARDITLTSAWNAAPDTPEDPFAVPLPTLLLATKADRIERVHEELASFRELSGYQQPALVVSAFTGDGLDQVGPFLFEHLGIVRVYTKVPGHAADLTRPFTVRRGQTVHAVAVPVHRELADGLHSARLWRAGIEGSNVGRDHSVEDGDVLELHG